MRIFLYIVILQLLFFSICFGQGTNLSFSQIITITSGTSYTVPADKALKIESLNLENNGFTVTSFYDSCRLVNYNTWHFTPNWGIECVYLEKVWLKIGTLVYNVNADIFRPHQGYGSVYPTPSQIDCSICPPTKLSIPAGFPNLNLPIWLKAGDQVFIEPLTGSPNILISCIEFNIIP
jgi:hypothetical protein